MSRIITMCKRCFPGVQRPERVTDHPLFLLPDVKGVGHTPPPALCACIVRSWCDLYLYFNNNSVSGTLACM